MKLSEISSSEPKRVKLSDVQQPETNVEPAPEKKSDKKSEPTLLERGKAVGKEAVTGGVMGAIAPELLTYGVAPAMMMTPMTAPFAPYVAGTGQALRGSRLASALSGTIGGATGETAGQVVESKYGPGMSAEAARLVGATIGPMPFEYLGTKTGGLIASLANRFIPGMSSARTVGQLLHEADVKPQSLTADQQRFIEQKLKDIRNGQPSLEAQKEIFDMLKKSVSKMSQDAETKALQLEQDAQMVLFEAKSSGAGITKELEQKISRLQGQFESAADNVRKGAQDQSQKILSQAQEKAQRIRASAEQQTPGVRQIAETDAKAAIDEGRKQADQIIKAAEARINKLKQTRDSLQKSIPKRMETAKGQVAAVGEAQTPTQTGSSIRDAVTPIFEKLKATRSQNATANKGEAFSAALVKEQSGQRVKDTASFKKAITEIDSAITNPETKLTNVSIDEVKNQLLKVKKALDPVTVDQQTGIAVGKPISFEGLENLRRFLRDRAYGLPAEGFDAIGQQQAGKLADAVEAIQREFSPSIGKFLEQYKKDSEPLRVFKTKLGEAVVGKEEFDMARFATDPATLGSKFFKSETGVKDLVTLLGGDVSKAEGIARGYAADRLRDASAKDVTKFLSDARDWIGQFPALKQQLTSAAEQLSAAEKVSGKRSTLSQTLRTEIQTLPIKAQTGMTRAEQDAARIAEAKLKAGEREVGKITTAAEREAGAALGAGETQATRALTEAERQLTQSGKAVEKQKGRLESDAEKLIREKMQAAQAESGQLVKTADAVRKEAQEKAQTILGGTTDATRIKDIILGKNAEVWNETAKIVLATPGGKEKFAEAVGQVIADEASKSLKGAITNMKYIGDNLTTYGLMDAKAVQQLQAKLEEIFVAPINLREKTTLAQRAVRNAIVSYAAPGVARAGESLLGGQ
jgi:hypothetical protein